MTSIEITIGGQKFMIRAEEAEAHLSEVAELVRRKVESIRKIDPNVPLQKAAMLAAFDFASDSINGRKKALEYRSLILTKAGALIERIESELAGPSPA
jgi:cell division protein ZapA (FtsZ GTPase activity inhibitor)